MEQLEENIEAASTSAGNKDDIFTEIYKNTYRIDEGNEEEEDTEEVEEGRLLTDQKYEIPKDEDKFIDTAKGEFIDKSKLTPFDVIRAVAKQTGTKIKNPRSGCKHCYGRGYIGWDYKTKAPIPCNCIYPPKTPDQKLQDNKEQTSIYLTRKTIKQLKKLIKMEKKLIKKQRELEEKRLKNIEG